MTTMANTPLALSVSELTRDAKTLLEAHFDRVSVEGEIGDFTAASSGHWYFTLKDANASVRCAMFRGANARVKTRPSKGDSVRIQARASLYESRGEFQLIVQHLAPAGDGALQQAFEQLKQQLMAEGLFDAARKQNVPNASRRVGVITSASGAVLHDIVSVLGRRSPMTAIYLFPVPVQGKEAPGAIVNAIQQANALHAIGQVTLDVLIVGRGGGSLEDLWAFNDERVARQIAASDLPIVSAVGHEVDFSIADFVADQRAATPSAAAELVSIDQLEWSQRFDRIGERLTRTLLTKVHGLQQQLGHLKARLRHPRQGLEQQRQQLNGIQKRLLAGARGHLRNNSDALNQLHNRLQRHHPAAAIAAQKAQLERDQQQLVRLMGRQIRERRGQLEHRLRLLQSLGPQNTLARGYAIVRDSEGHVLHSASAVSAGSALQVNLSRGALTAQVTGVTTDAASADGQ